MPGPRDYGAGTKAALAALSGATCYFPACSAPILRFIDGEPYIEYQIAHIRDAKEGNRYDRDMSDDERRSFQNLILLCKAHHELVDKRHPERFSTQELTSWKVAREDGHLQALAQIGPTSPERLEEDIKEAAVLIKNSPISLGGIGGSAPGAGGGGGGVLGSGRGGDGGPGGPAILLDGSPATAPGAGGGGGGNDVEGGYAGEGGGGGQIVTGLLDAEDVDWLQIRVGKGGDAGQNGEATSVTVFGADGTEKARIEARGGEAGRSGSAIRDQVEGPALRVTSAFLAHSLYLSDGLMHVLGGGWSVLPVADLPTEVNICLALLAEPREPGSRDTELRVDVVNERGIILQTLTCPFTYSADELPCVFPFYFNFSGLEATAEEIWVLRVTSGGQALASTAFRIRRARSS